MGDKLAHPSYYLSMRVVRISIYSTFGGIIISLLMSLSTSAAYGAELHMPLVAGGKGEEVKLAVTVDKVENLAGIKLAMKYDNNILKFIKADITSYTSNMLHVVNDKVTVSFQLICKVGAES